MELLSSDIEEYLKKVKTLIDAGQYRIELNGNRLANRDLFSDYVFTEEMLKQILLSLDVTDFSEAVQNEHKGFEHETLYVFGKEVKLLPKFGGEKESVNLYIKFNKLGSKYVIVISFHKQMHPLKYKFE